MTAKKCVGSASTRDTPVVWGYEDKGSGMVNLPQFPYITVGGVP